MSRELYLSSRFRRTVREYPKPVRVEIGRALDCVCQALGDPHQHAGLGIRKLVRSYYEARAGLKLRLIFKIEPDAVIVVFAGTHDEVREFLKSI